MAEMLGSGLQVPQIQTSTPAMEEARTHILEQQRSSEAEVDRLRPEVTKARADYASELAKPIPQDKPLQDIQQFQPKQISGQDMSQFAAIAMAFAALGTKAMRGDITMAMNAAAGAMKGFNEGADAQADKEMKEFEAKMRSAIEQNKKLTHENEMLMKRRDLSLQQKQQLAQLAALSVDDEIRYNAFRTGGWKTVFELDAKRLDAQNRATEYIFKVQAHYQEMKERRAQTAALAHARMGGGGAADGSGGLTDVGKTYMAASISMYGRAPVGFSRFNPAAISSWNEMAETLQKSGVSPERFAANQSIIRSQAAALTDLEKRRNVIQAYEGMAVRNIEVLKKLSEEVDRTGSKLANKPLLWLEQNAATDPKVSTYLLQTEIVRREIAALTTSPNLTGVISDTSRNEIMSVISENLPDAALKAVLDRAIGDVHNRSRGLDDQRNKVLGEMRSGLTEGDKQKSDTSLPQGSKKIGKTPQGKDVWQSPDGKKWVE